MLSRTGWAVCVSCCALGAPPARAMILYVKSTAVGANDGTTWTNAYTGVQSALTFAIPGDQIWVAAGVYLPTQRINPSDPRSATFQLINGVILYGGFPATGTPGLAQRNPAVHVTILSGDLNGNDGPNFANDGENAYHVVTANYTDATAVLNGFTITAGHANGTSDQYGGGLYNFAGSPTIVNCRFNANQALYGGAIINNTGGGGTLTGCVFDGNKATQIAGVYNYQAGLVATNCTFRNGIAQYCGGVYNFANDGSYTNCLFESNTISGLPGSAGGGMFNTNGSSVTITNCRFNGNRVTGSSSSGGGIVNQGSNPTISDCTFTNNFAGAGGGIHQIGGAGTIRRCTFDSNAVDRNLYGGGGIALSNCTTVVDRCRFLNNTSLFYGGGIIVDSNSPAQITNCTFYRNSAPTGAAFFGVSSPFNLVNCTLYSTTGTGVYTQNADNSKITNCILYGTAIEFGSVGTIPAVTYSNVRGGLAGTGNINADPLYADAPNENLHLLSGSPSLNTGSNAGIPGGVVLDLDDNARIVGAAVDMGAYEKQAATSTPTIVNWRCVRTHGAAGDFSILLDPSAVGNGFNGPGVDPRSGGSVKVQVDFDMPVSIFNLGAISVTGRTTSGGVMGSPVSYPPSATSMLDSDTLQLLFSPGALPDQTCYTINITGAMRNGSGLGPAADTQCSFRILIGDTTGDGAVTLSDSILAKVKATAGTAVALGPRYDLDLSGVIDLADGLLSKGRVSSPARRALCP